MEALAARSTSPGRAAVPAAEQVLMAACSSVVSVFSEPTHFGVQTVCAADAGFAASKTPAATAMRTGQEKFARGFGVMFCSHAMGWEYYLRINILINAMQERGSIDAIFRG